MVGEKAIRKIHVTPEANCMDHLGVVPDIYDQQGQATPRIRHVVGAVPSQFNFSEPFLRGGQISLKNISSDH